MRVGLVGWAVRTGVGQINADVARLADWVTDWLVPRHKTLVTEPALARHAAIWPCERWNDEDAWRRFVDRVDALLFVETPYVRGFDLAAWARARGKRVACVPMLDWLDPGAEWLESVDLFWAPTRAARRTLSEQLGPARVAGGYWGVDLMELPFRPRRSCERFLFVNGFGGFAGRKGADVVAAAAALAPEIPLIVRSQTAELPALPAHVEVRLEDLPERADLYTEGDALLAPSFWEGLGLPLYEAQARGLPVLTTDAPPMNECGGRLVPADPASPVQTLRLVERWAVRPAALADSMRAMQGRPIEAESRAARARVEAGHDLRAVLTELHRALVGGV
jgi:glycosyltransferase involved in cell wall biosynthesis